MIKICKEQIDPTALYNLIARDRAGSVVFHYAVVKRQNSNEGVTTCIEYDAVGDAEAELETIAAGLKEAWDLEDVVLMRRIGCLGIGDIISLVAASSPNSEDAFASCRQGIARLKKMNTIQKKESYA